MYVKGIGAQPVAQREGHHLSPGPNQAANQAQGIEIAQRVVDRVIFIAQLFLLLRLHLAVPLGEPGVVHGDALGDVGVGEWFKHPVRIVLVKPVNVVALAVELLALQVGQLIHGIDIVVGLPVLLKAEPAWHGRFQLLPELLGHTDDLQRHPAEGTGVLCHRLDHRLQRSGADGEEIARLSALEQAHDQAVAHSCDHFAEIAPPQIDGGEIVLARTGGTGLQNRVDPDLVRHRGRVKGQHTSYLLPRMEGLMLRGSLPQHFGFYNQPRKKEQKRAKTGGPVPSAVPPVPLFTSRIRWLWSRGSGSP